MPARFDINEFARSPQAVARIASAQEVFSLLNRTLTLPPGCAALVWEHNGPPKYLPAGAPIESNGVARLLFVRTPIFRLLYHFTKLTSQDGYDLSATVDVPVQIVAERAELAAFCQHVVGSSGEVTVEHLTHYGEESFRAAATAYAKANDIVDLLSPETWKRFDAVAAEHFKPVGFSSGLALAGDVRITIESSDYARAAEAQRTHKLRERRIEEQRRLRELASEARAAHVSDLASTLDKLRELSAKSEGTSLIEWIRTLDPSQRGGLYHAMLAQRHSAEKTESILLVAGEELIWIDPASPQGPARRLSLSSEIGPLRSVRLARWEGRIVILVGARSGVHLLQTEQDPRQTYAFKVDQELRGGVNSACIVGEHLYATHSEVGLVRWPLRRPERFERLMTDMLDGAKSVRDVQADDAGRIWLAADRRVIGMTLEAEQPPIILQTPATVTAMTIADGSVFAGLEAGQILQWPTAHPELMEMVRPPSGSPVESIEHLEGGGVSRLLVADRRPYLDLLVLGDTSSMRYAAGQPLRWGFAAADLVAAVSDRRDQLTLWRTDSPAEPIATVQIGQIIGRSIQDAAVVCCGAFRQ